MALLSGGAAQAGALRVLDVETGPGLVRSVQVRDADVFFDDDGNRILMDRATGEIISIRPANPNRRRPVREPLQDEFGNELPSYDYDANAFPEAPDDYNRDYGNEPMPAPSQPRARSNVARGEPAPRRTERRALPAPGGNPATTVRPSDTPEFRAPQDTAVATPSDGANTDSETTGAVTPAEPVATPEKQVMTSPSITIPGVGGARQDVAALQILLDRAGASPGVIDGRFGSNVDKAIVAYRRITGKDLKSFDAVGITQALAETGGDPFMEYTLTAEDVAGPFVASVPEDYSLKAKLEHMSFTSVAEALAERFHMDENYLKAINPDANFSRVGTIIKVANTGTNVSGKVARITADKAKEQVLVYDAYDKLIASYPATIGSADTPSPVGTHAVARIAFDPNYTYNPKINFKQGENDKVLTIPPGPNGPVGSIWIALDKPTYGVHGTPEPSKIGKTASHGCVRLTNWDATELAKMVSAGVTVEFME